MDKKTKTDNSKPKSNEQMKQNEQNQPSLEEYIKNQNFTEVNSKPQKGKPFVPCENPKTQFEALGYNIGDDPMRELRELTLPKKEDEEKKAK